MHRFKSLLHSKIYQKKYLKIHSQFNYLVQTHLTRIFANNISEVSVIYSHIIKIFNLLLGNFFQKITKNATTVKTEVTNSN